MFVDWSDTRTDPSVRIFTPATELPFAGHPLVGTAWVFENLGPESTGRIATRVGPVSYRTVNDKIEVDLSIPISVVDIDATIGLVEDAGLPAPVATRTLALPKHYYLAEYPTPTQVLSLAPDMSVLNSYPLGLYAFALADGIVVSRFFAPSVGVGEDPGTGSAAVALAEEMRLRGGMRGQLTIHQGDAIGQPCTISLTWDEASTTLGGSVIRDDLVLV